MAFFELISGDFERESVRLRYSEAGRPYLRLTSLDGVVEDILLQRDVAGVAESGEGRVGEYLARWAERDGFVLRDLKVASSPRTGTSTRRADGRGEAIFVVLLRDGRKFVARGSVEAVSEIRLASLPADRRAKLSRLDAARAGRAPETGLLPRFVPGLLARLLPER
jgi:hypothetical protein